jgi:hypothetical protein
VWNAVRADALARAVAAGHRIVAPGQYQRAVGGGQPGTRAPGVTTSFTIRGSSALPD